MHYYSVIAPKKVILWLRRKFKYIQVDYKNVFDVIFD